VTFNTSSVFAKSIKVAALAGYGSATAAVKTVTLSESPMSMGIFIDYPIDERRYLGAEHIRSINLSPLSSGVSLTGITGKWYFYRPAPQSFADDIGARVTIHEYAISPYGGAAFGFAQSSLFSQTSGANANTVGAYLGLKAGADFPLFRQFGARTEGGFTYNVVGEGKLQVLHFQLGFYVHL